MNIIKYIYESITFPKKQYHEKINLINNGEGFHVFCKDPDWDIRMNVMNKGYKLHKFTNDPSEYLRRELANHINTEPWLLDVLMFDKSWYVRENVALHGHGLDILINDEDETVRSAVVKQRYKLDVLINDPSPYVRMKVAEQLYGLETLMNDPEIAVSYVAITKFMSIHSDDKDIVNECIQKILDMGSIYVDDAKISIMPGNFITKYFMNDDFSNNSYKESYPNFYFYNIVFDDSDDDDEIIFITDIRPNEEYVSTIVSDKEIDLVDIYETNIKCKFLSKSVCNKLLNFHYALYIE